ncbi:MAG TPA: vitamin B12 dependent-methionine synthase activation domain-containing protein [Oscillospiraceae bacterium]|nr:vitamin B12 dependent-methionine synthase activation domain-containing protein [Oscillospiraceae bacterium]
MEKHIVNDIKFNVTEEDFLKAIDMKRDPGGEDYIRVTELLSQALGIARPKYIYCISAIEEKGDGFVVAGGQRFDSKLVRRNLDKVHRIVPYVATCGVEIEEWSRQFTDLLEQFWADELKKLVLFKCYADLQKTVKSAYFPAQDLSHMSPGSLADWPLSGQIPLFNLIGNVIEDIGVVLTDSLLMLPSKTVSGFYFSSASNAFESHYENCKFCPMPNCPGRRAPYSGKTE